MYWRWARGTVVVIYERNDDLHRNVDSDRGSELGVGVGLQ